MMSNCRNLLFLVLLLSATPCFAFESLESLVLQGNVEAVRDYLSSKWYWPSSWILQALNERDESWKPLHFASQQGQAEMVRALLEFGADPDVTPSGWSKPTPLHIAASYGHLEIVQILLDAGANIDAQDEEYSYGLTPLFSAARNGHGDVFSFLLSRGANFRLRNREGNTAFGVIQRNNRNFMRIRRIDGRPRRVILTEPRNCANPIFGFACIL